jgi:hypothetical protein
MKNQMLKNNMPKPKIGSKYYYIGIVFDQLIIISAWWTDSLMDKFLLVRGNYFKTKKEATAYLKEINNKIDKVFK